MSFYIVGMHQVDENPNITCPGVNVTSRYQLLYTSNLSPEHDASCVLGIVHSARRKNRDLNIEGMLVFDGWRFCQYLEGPVDEAKNLFEIISKDHRHCDFRKLHESIASSERLFPSSPLAFALANDDLIPRLAASKDGGVALSILRDAVDTLDMTL